MVDSNHNSITIITDPKEKIGRKQFKFDDMWMEDLECDNVIQETWETLENSCHREHGFGPESRGS